MSLVNCDRLDCAPEIAKLVKRNPDAIPQVNKIIQSLYKQFKLTTKGGSDTAESPPQRVYDDRGEYFAILPGISCVTPRAKFHWLVCKSAIVLKDAKENFVALEKTNIAFAYMLYEKDSPISPAKLLVVLKKPVTWRKKPVTKFLFNPGNSHVYEVPVIAAHAPASTLATATTSPDDPAAKVLVGDLQQLAEEVLTGALGVKLGTPERSAFVTTRDEYSMNCFNGMNDGRLFLLPHAIVFLSKVVDHIRLDTIEELEIGRSNRFLTLVVGVQGDDNRMEFHTIDQGEQVPVHTYIENYKEKKKKKERSKAKSVGGHDGHSSTDEDGSEDESDSDFDGNSEDDGGSCTDSSDDEENDQQQHGKFEDEDSAEESDDEQESGDDQEESDGESTEDDDVASAPQPKRRKR